MWTPTTRRMHNTNHKAYAHADNYSRSISHLIMLFHFRRTYAIRAESNVGGVGHLSRNSVKMSSAACNSLKLKYSDVFFRSTVIMSWVTLNLEKKSAKSSVQFSNFGADKWYDIIIIWVAQTWCQQRLFGHLPGFSWYFEIQRTTQTRILRSFLIEIPCL